MPRTARFAPGRMVYHVLNRGVGKQKLFYKDEDYLAVGQSNNNYCLNVQIQTV